MTAPRSAAPALLLACALAASAAAASRSGTLDWRAASDRVDARIEAWPLPAVLAEIAAATGWRVYLEPGTESDITTTFDGLSQTDALRRLLGTLNFALLPQPAGGSALFVFRRSPANATREIAAAAARRRSGPPGSAVAGELIVVLAPGGHDIGALARRLGATVAGEAAAGRRAFRLTFDDETAARDAARALENDPAVEHVERNVLVAPPASIEPLPGGGGPTTGLRPAASPSTSSVIVGLIDTAVQSGDPGLAAFLQPHLSLAGEYTPPEGHAHARHRDGGDHPRRRRARPAGSRRPFGRPCRSPSCRWTSTATTSSPPPSTSRAASPSRWSRASTW